MWQHLYSYTVNGRYHGGRKNMTYCTLHSMSRLVVGETVDLICCIKRLFSHSLSLCIRHKFQGVALLGSLVPLPRRCQVSLSTSSPLPYPPVQPPHQSSKQLTEHACCRGRPAGAFNSSLRILLLVEPSLESTFRINCLYKLTA